MDRSTLGSDASESGPEMSAMRAEVAAAAPTPPPLNEDLETYRDFYQPFDAGGPAGAQTVEHSGGGHGGCGRGGGGNDGGNDDGKGGCGGGEGSRGAGSGGGGGGGAAAAEAALGQPARRLRAWWQRISSLPAEAESAARPRQSALVSPAPALASALAGAPSAVSSASAAAAAGAAMAARAAAATDARAAEAPICVSRAHALFPGLTPAEAEAVARQLRARGMRVSAPSPWRARLLADELTEEQTLVLCSHPACKGLETIAIEQDGIRTGSRGSGAAPACALLPPTARAPLLTLPAAAPAAATTVDTASWSIDASPKLAFPPPPLRLAGLGVASRAAANDLLGGGDNVDEDEDEHDVAESAAMSLFNGLSGHLGR